MKGTSDPRFEGGDIQSAFATDLKYLMGNPIALWCFGHTVSYYNKIIYILVPYIIFFSFSIIQVIKLLIIQE